jgi:hypothetical protein
LSFHSGCGAHVSPPISFNHFGILAAIFSNYSLKFAKPKCENQFEIFKEQVNSKHGTIQHAFSSTHPQLQPNSDPTHPSETALGFLEFGVAPLHTGLPGSHDMSKRGRRPTELPPLLPWAAAAIYDFFAGHSCTHTHTAQLTEPHQQ